MVARKTQPAMRFQGMPGDRHRVDAVLKVIAGCRLLPVWPGNLEMTNCTSFASDEHAVDGSSANKASVPLVFCPPHKRFQWCDSHTLIGRRCWQWNVSLLENGDEKRQSPMGECMCTCPRQLRHSVAQSPPYLWRQSPPLLQEAELLTDVRTTARADERIVQPGRRR